LPPLEAMASGVPVLVAERASLPEVTGDAALRLDPARPDDTAVKLASLLDDKAIHDDFARIGLERAAGFTWDACAQATLRVYRSVMGVA
jgi:glycosyltransferase involved in cell wall biosynthesis